MKNFFGNTLERFTMSHPLFGQKNNSSFASMSQPSSSNSDYIFISQNDQCLQVIQYIFIIIAVYLALRCKKNGNISVLQVILAIIFAPLYILYRFIKPCM